MYSKAINEEINEKDKKNRMFPSRSTLIGGVETDLRDVGTGSTHGHD